MLLWVGVIIAILLYVYCPQQDANLRLENEEINVKLHGEKLLIGKRKERQFNLSGTIIIIIIATKGYSLL